MFLPFLLISGLIVSAQDYIPQNAIKHLPNISIFNINGTTFNLQALSKNKIAVIEFWYLPCPPCFRQMNSFYDLYSKLKNDSNIIFLTISRTDSSTIKPLIQNDTAGNDAFKYYKSLSNLNAFDLPTYFIKGCNERLEYFRMTDDERQYVTSMIKPYDNSQCPDVIFNFTHYPTLLVFNKMGDLIYNRTGYYGDHVKKEFKQLKKVILSNL